MLGTQIKAVEDPGPFKAQGRLLLLQKFGYVASIGLLAVVFGLALLFEEQTLFWQHYLIDMFFFLGFALFGLVLTAIHYASNSTWSVNIRRVSEGLTGFLPMAALFIAVFLAFGISYVYDWAIDHHIWEHFSKSKQAFVSTTGYIIVSAVFLASMFLFKNKLISSISLRQDLTENADLSKKGVSWGIAFLFIFFYTFSLFSVELLMAINSTWFSTMFGVYVFIGLFVSGFSLTSIFAVKFMEAGYLKDAIKEHHLKDLGTWQMGFGAFMMYIGFSQFMLIWYANLPAEVAYFSVRMNNGWEYIFVLLPILKFILPFIGLMPWRYRSNPNAFKFIGGLVILGHWLDLFWMVMPGGEAGPTFSFWLEPLMFIAFLMAFGAGVLRFYSKHSLLAHKDPKLLTSINGQHL
jgi:hypothetical protein